ncbi:GRAM domain-containing protein 2A isoform X21 [Mustela lutreola]|uniref:GRAM domain-containing protein 2A isoform X21 n=1 Tax=Mustela lutreola TaxID=9666 RepID=UPI00279784DB|nr:GRAM domain-containing protein 2A isoform X21 [Mustela lutreola]
MGGARPVSAASGRGLSRASSQWAGWGGGGPTGAGSGRAVPDSCWRGRDDRSEPGRGLRGGQDPKTPSNLPCALRRSRRVHKAGVILSDQQMRGKTASLKSSVSCSEKLARVQAPLDSSLHWPEGLKGEEIKKCGREGTLLSKYNQQYHKLFKDIPLEEVVLKVCSCALQRDLLLQGRLYISPNWLCFHASLFGKDIKVVIPVVSVQMIKKHKMARLLPNGLAITTNTSQKYVFVSLLSRDSVYDMLRRVCTHLQPSSKKSLSVREFPEEPECESLVRAEEVLIPEMKWRKVCPASRSLSLPDNIPCIPRASMDSTDSFFPRKPPGSENDVCEEEKLEEEPRSDGKLRLWDYQLLKVIFVLICFLVMSSSYLAFRISRLEQQLCSLNWDGPVPGHR